MTWMSPLSLVPVRVGVVEKYPDPTLCPDVGQHEEAIRVLSDQKFLIDRKRFDPSADSPGDILRAVRVRGEDRLDPKCRGTPGRDFSGLGKTQAEASKGLK